MVYNYQIIVFVNFISIFDYIVNNFIIEMHTKYKLDIQCKLLIQRLNNHYIVNNNLTIFIRSNNEGLIVITPDVSRFITLFKDR
jgi:hypothetical protein